MSKTNCINCGAAKEVSDMQCPFCGTKYADVTMFDLLHMDKFYIQMRKGDQVITAKAYITDKTLRFHPKVLDISSVNGTRRMIQTGMNVSGSIDFTLYESI